MALSSPSFSPGSRRSDCARAAMNSPWWPPPRHARAKRNVQQCQNYQNLFDFFAISDTSCYAEGLMPASTLPPLREEISQELGDIECHGPLPVRRPQKRPPGDFQALLPQGKPDQTAVIQIGLHGPFAEVRQSLPTAGRGCRGFGRADDDVAMRRGMGGQQEFQILEARPHRQAVSVEVLRPDVYRAHEAALGESMGRRYEGDQIVSEQLHPGCSRKVVDKGRHDNIDAMTLQGIEFVFIHVG